MTSSTLIFPPVSSFAALSSSILPIRTIQRTIPTEPSFLERFRNFSPQRNSPKSDDKTNKFPWRVDAVTLCDRRGYSVQVWKMLADRLPVVTCCRVARRTLEWTERTRTVSRRPGKTRFPGNSARVRNSAVADEAPPSMVGRPPLRRRLLRTLPFVSSLRRLMISRLPAEATTYTQTGFR